MIRRGLFLTLLLMSAAASAALVRPAPRDGISRLQSVDYREGQVVLLELAPGYHMMVELGPDELIENVAVGDTAAWQVTANRRGDRLFVKALEGGVSTNMTVVTNTRLYTMELAPLTGAPSEMAYVVRFNYPQPEHQQGGPLDGRYRLVGDGALHPIAISDDGARTYIQWSEAGPPPAVYSVGDNGQESLVNGMMRDGLFVIDSVVPRLVFRSDGKSAEAARLSAESR